MTGPRFELSLVRDLDEPVQRFFAHAIAEGTALGDGVRLTMRGSVKVGAWLPFTAEQTVDGRSFEWLARVGWGPVTPLTVMDRYADGAGSTEGRLLGRVTVFRADDANTARSAAGRAALESVVFAPTTVLAAARRLVAGRSEDVIVGRFDLPPERPEVRARIDEHGRLRTVRALRWGNPGRDAFDYVACGCEVHAERRFGGLVVPSRLSVGWWFDTPRYAPFFRARIDSVTQD